MSDVDVPKVGKIKKQYVIVGGVGVAAYVLWRYYQASQATAADTAVAAPESAGTIGADIGSGTGGYYGTDSAASSTVVGNTLTTDQEWYAAAMLVLEDAGYDTGAGSLALGKYLRTEPLTATEQSMVKVALAGAGNPPSGAKALVTDNSPAPSGLTAPQHLRSNGSATTSTAPMRWDAVAGAASYIVYRGTTQLGTVSGTTYTAGGLSAGTSYSFTVRAQNTGGTLSAASAPYTVKTVTVVPVKSTKPVAQSTTVARPAPPKVPAHRTIYIPPRGNLSTSVSNYNKKWHTNHSVDEVWNFNLKYRDAATVKKFQTRGKNKVFAGTSFWIPV